MKDKQKTKSQLLTELKALQKRIDHLESLIDERKNENKLEQRDKYLTALSNVASVLLQENKKIPFNKFTEIIGKASQSDRTYIFINHKNEDSEVFMSQKAEYCAEGINPEIDNPDLQNLKYDNFFTRWYKTLSKGEIISGNINDFPKGEKEFLGIQGIKTILIIPIMIDKKFIGFIGFDNCISEREWETSEKNYLQSAAKDFAQFLKSKKIQEQLEKEYIHFQTTMDAIDSPVYVTDMQTYEILFSNKAFNNSFGEHIGKKCYSVIQKGQMSPCSFCTNNLLLNENGNPKEPYVWEFQNTITKQWYQCRDQAIRWIDGKFVRLEIAIDITERKQAEKTIKESEKKYRLLSETMKDVVLKLSPSGKLLYVSSAIKKFGGYIPEEEIGNNMSKYFSKKSDLFRALKLLNEVIVTHKSGNFEFIFKPKNKATFPVELTFVPLIKSGKVYAIQLVLRDITERKNTEKELKKAKEKAEENENRFKILSEATHEAILISEKGIIVDTNGAISKITGYSYNEIIGSQAIDFIATESKDIVKKNMISKYEKPYDAVGQCKDGTKKHIEIIGRMFEYKGKEMRITAVRDITERKKAEQKIKDYAKFQEQLLQEVNHRVKNNLYAITGMLYKEKEKILKKGEPKQVEIIDEIIHRLVCLSTVHSLLSVSKWQPLKLIEICENLVDQLFNTLNRREQVVLKINKINVKVNSNQVQQIALVINEILTNIKKYSQIAQKKLIITINITKDEENIYIKIKDNGLGFPQKILDGDFSNVGIGFDLIFGIVNRNLAGSVSIENDNGAVVNLIIKNFN